MGVVKRLPTESANRALKVISGRYKLHILSHCIAEPRRLSELSRLVPQVSQKTLIHQLRELETHGLIDWIIGSVKPNHVLYRSTDLGKSLCPLIEALCAWGLFHADTMQSEL